MAQAVSYSVLHVRLERLPTSSRSVRPGTRSRAWRVSSLRQPNPAVAQAAVTLSGLSDHQKSVMLAEEKVP